MAQISPWLPQRTRIPSNLAATNVSPGSLTASANSCPSIPNPPQPKLSRLRYPLSDPVPYWISNFVPFFLWEFERSESYWLWRRHAMLNKAQRDEGTQRLLDPVSKMTEKA